MRKNKFISFLNQTLKLQNWWIPKIAPGIFTWILFSLVLKKECDFNTFASFFLIFACLILLAILGHLINDLSDFKHDQKAGKSNVFDTIGWKNRGWIIGSLSVFIFALSIFLPKEIQILIVIQILLNCCYSLKPIRLKERGWWSLIVTGFYERSIPYLIIICSIYPILLISNDQLLFLALYLTWSFFWESRNFITGQIEDKENDHKSGLNTIAVSVHSTILARRKKQFLTMELIFLITWLSTWGMLFDFSMILFICLNLLIISIHLVTIKDLFYKESIERLLDFVYCYSFLSGIVIYSLILEYINFYYGVAFLVLFLSGYTKATCLFFFNKIFFVCSFVVNHVIYYLRKLF